jgi:membrane protein
VRQAASLLVRKAGAILRDVYCEWERDRVPRLSAALAFYTTFSLAPVLMIALALAGLAFGREAAAGELVSRTEGMVGPEAARFVQSLIAASRARSPLATAAGVAASILGATAVFMALQEALNTIWGVVPKPGRPVWTHIRKRILSFLMVLATGLLLVLSLVSGAVLSFAEGFLATHAPEQVPFRAILGLPGLWQGLNHAGSLIVFTVAFALIYRILPDVEIRWRDVWLGAAITSLLFNGGTYLIALYLGRSTFASAYGAAGSFVLLLVWTYWSAQVFLIGGELTQVCARMLGSDIRPDQGALRVTGP